MLSHKLLVRAGYVRRTAAGIWSWLPLGKKVLANVERIVREEMDAIGAQEVSLPALLPKEPYEATGRWEEYGAELFRLNDRKGGDYLLGPTHEEIFTLLVKDQCTSYKDLPVILYQIQTKFRDEARPRAGILRGREFLMKDSYSFDTEDEGLARSYALHREAYRRVFERLGLDYRICAATAGAMGGSKSEEFLAPAEAGEDTFADCPNCDFAANTEAITYALSPVDAEGVAALEEIPTPDTPTIETLAAHLGVPASATLKNLLVKVDGEIVAVASPVTVRSTSARWRRTSPRPPSNWSPPRTSWAAPTWCAAMSDRRAWARRSPTSPTRGWPPAPPGSPAQQGGHAREERRRGP